MPVVPDSICLAGAVAFEVGAGGVLACEAEGCDAAGLAVRGVVGVDLGEGFVDTGAVLVPDLVGGFVGFPIGVLVDMGEVG